MRGDDLAAARGILNGLLISIVLWAIIFVVIFFLRGEANENESNNRSIGSAITDSSEPSANDPLPQLGKKA